AGALAGEQSYPLHRLLEGLPLEDRPLVVVLRDDPLVVREGPLEDAAGELALAEPEGEVMLPASVGDGLRAAETEQLLARLAGNEPPVLASLPRHGVAVLASRRRLHERQTMTIGRHHLEAFGLHLEESAVELEPRLLGRDGEDHLADHPA